MPDLPYEERYVVSHIGGKELGGIGNDRGRVSRKALRKKYDTTNYS